MKAGKYYEGGRVYAYIVDGEYKTCIQFDSETQMRRAGQCLIDLARIGGNEVEIKDKKSDMTQEEIKKKMQEGVAKLTPIVTEVSSLIADAYQEGFKTCWELLTGQKFE